MSNNREDKSFRPSNHPTRREIVAGGAMVPISMELPTVGAAQSSTGATTQEAVSVRLTVNGTRHALALDPRTTLLDLLREHLDLTGTKKGCRIINANIVEYHVPVNADVHDIRVIFVDEPNDSNPLGVKGLGEIGIVGVSGGDRQRGLSRDRKARARPANYAG